MEASQNIDGAREKYIPNLLVRIRFRACNLKKVEVAIVWSTTKELVGFYLRACGLKSQRKIDFCPKFVPRAGRAFRRSSGSPCESIRLAAKVR